MISVHVEVVRHQARIIELEYPKTVDSEEEDPKHTLMLVGKVGGDNFT